VKTDLFPDEIYVFTPEGRILELPTNATPVDFAYAVHTDIGNSCVGARVERQPFPLSRPLTSGQTVEIITAPGARPNAAWLNFVVTSRARTKIRQFLKNLRAEESIILGRRLLSHSLGGKKIEDMPAENLRQVLHDTRHDSLEGLLADIGLGNQMSVVIARRLLGQHEQEPEKEKKSSSTHRKLPIRGSGGMLVTFANCCRPNPGDAIIAHISPGKGLVVHQESCPNLRGYNREPDKYQPVQWDMEQLGEQEFRTSIVVEVVNHQGVLAQLANVIAATGANIHSISTEEKDARVYQVNLLITTKHRVHLANIMRKIRVMPDVLRVNRTTNKIRSKESS
jgi:guanosine-3',5'-bis(diphosphate) 3'-pyrophosphohydrolase